MAIKKSITVPPFEPTKRSFDLSVALGRDLTAEELNSTANVASLQRLWNSWVNYRATKLTADGVDPKNERLLIWARGVEAQEHGLYISAKNATHLV